MELLDLLIWSGAEQIFPLYPHAGCIGIICLLTGPLGQCPSSPSLASGTHSPPPCKILDAARSHDETAAASMRSRSLVLLQALSVMVYFRSICAATPLTMVGTLSMVAGVVESHAWASSGQRSRSFLYMFDRRSLPPLLLSESPMGTELFDSHTVNVGLEVHAVPVAGASVVCVGAGHARLRCDLFEFGLLLTRRGALANFLW